MSRAIVWFRNDLRIRDNEVLFQASQDFDEILPVYIVDKNILSASYFQAKRMGIRRLNFIFESLENLHHDLKILGSGLHVEIGNPSAIIERLTKENSIDSIYAQKEIGPEEIRLENAVRELADKSVVIKFFWGKTLFHSEDLPFQISDLPDVFTSFRKICEKKSQVRSAFPIPTRVFWKENIELNLPNLEELQFTKGQSDQRSVLKFKGGEAQALNRLKDYFFETESLSTYKDTRNGMIGANYSSKFSPWLATGNFSPRQIYFEVKKYEKEITSNSSTYWLIFELIWRDYFTFILLRYGANIFRRGGIKDAKEEIEYVDNRTLELWKKGKTGVPFVDANMRELNLTGFMSNRGRQNVASFLVKDLQVDWRYGASYFEERLIDYDLASNWGNWAYVAGVGNDPREDRYFNIMTQAKRYDPHGEYVKLWIPELEAIPEEYIHTPWQLDYSSKHKQGLDSTPFAKPVCIPNAWNL